MAMKSDRKNRVWLVRIGRDGEDEKIPRRALDEGFICIGWTALGDVSLKRRRQIKAMMKEKFPNRQTKWIESSAGQVYRFAHDMQIGDVVLSPIKETREIAIGKVVGDYHFKPPSDALNRNDYAHFREVEWTIVVPRMVFSKATLLKRFRSRLTLSVVNAFSSRP